MIASNAGEGANAAIADAAEKGIPVLTIDTSIPSDDVVAHLATDNVLGGALAAEAMVEELEKAGIPLEGKVDVYKRQEENRIKIEKAIRELSYQPNPMASGLKTSKTYTVGCVLPEITDPFFPPIIRIFQKKMMEAGYQTIFNTYGNDFDQEIEQVRTLANKRVDGLRCV